MTRPSKREIERIVEELEGREPSEPSEVSVRAAFVSYRQDSGDVEAPDGWTSTTESGSGGVTYHVVERDPEPNEGER